MGTPTVTVIIPTYNRAKLLFRAIGSVQAQTFSHFVIAVYDNASTDETAAVVEAAAAKDQRIRYLRHDSNIGAEGNFRSALGRIDTPLFCFLSDDDVIFPHFLEDAVSWLDRFSEARFAAGGTLEVTETGELLFAPQAYWPRDGYFEPPQGLDLMLTGFHPSWTTMVFRRQVLDEVGEFAPGLANVGDCEYTFRIACRYPYVIFRKPSGIFVRHASSSSESADVSVIEQYETVLGALVAADDVAPETKRLAEKSIREALKKRVLQVAVKQLLRIEPRLAVHTLSTYHRRYPRTPATAFVASVARSGELCRPLLRLLHPLDALRRSARRAMNRYAARANGIETPDARTYAGYFKAS